MSIFSKKKELTLKDFCRGFYDMLIKKADSNDDYPDFFKKSLTEVDPDFANVDPLMLKNELIILRCELFALVWAHKFGERSAIDQSIFTKNYLKEKGKIEIWNGMGHYNKAISHSTTAGMDDVNKAFWIRMKTDTADKYIAIAEKKGIVVDESLGWPINRLFSEKAWKEKKTSYFLMLGLCHKFGLGYGKDYHGPKDEAQARFIVFITDFYNAQMQFMKNVKIVN